MAEVRQGGYTDRVTDMSGAVGLKDPRQIQMIMNAEVKPLNCCGRCQACLFCCSTFDLERSYLYVRENSIESNFAISPCCGMCGIEWDHIAVTYFDRPPYAVCCADGCCENCCAGRQEVRIVDSGCMCCCMKCCSEEWVSVATPKVPFPCCCIPNEVNFLMNSCGLCGPVSGNPCSKTFSFPQPMDAQAYMTAVNSVLTTFDRRGAPPAPDGVEGAEPMKRV
jgi:hypothetical protein